jgi:hypothetical protein
MRGRIGKLVASLPRGEHVREILVARTAHCGGATRTKTINLSHQHLRVRRPRRYASFCTGLGRRGTLVADKSEEYKVREQIAQVGWAHISSLVIPLVHPVRHPEDGLSCQIEVQL